MVWPPQRLADPPMPNLPAAYELRSYRSGDEARFFQLMALAGWPGWDDERLRPWLFRMLPAGWFMAVHQESGQIVATAMALHDHTWQVPFCGELGWVAVDPAHAGRGLGTAVAAAATARFVEARYPHIHLFTETFRLAALRIYLKLGYLPLLNAPGAPDRWQAICQQLQWPFTPEAWPALP